MGFRKYKIVLLLAACPASLAAADWRPIAPADFALKAARVEKDASAEALFWEVRLKDNVSGAHAQVEFNHYLRIKIFTDKGRDKATVEIPYWNKVSISDIAGRTVKPNGAVSEMEKDAVFDKNVVKVGGLKVKVKSFVLPNVEAGDIIEYQWREIRDEQISNNMRLPLQRDIPIERVRYIIKPLQVPYLPYAMRVLYLQVPNTPFQPEGRGFSVVEFQNMPALHEEVYMPPEEAIRSALLIYYAPEFTQSAEKFWADYGKRAYSFTKESLKINGDVKSAAAEAVAGASTDEQKVQKLYSYCRTKIKNTASRDGDISPDEIRDMRDNNTPANTLKQGIGTGRDIDMLFAAMSSAAGLDVRVARVGDADTSTMGPLPPHGAFLPAVDVAVRVNGKWRFYDPGTPDLPAGMLRWEEEGMPALLTDAKAPEFATATPSQPTQNQEKRVATLNLSADGQLEGTVREELTGQVAFRERRRMSGKTAADCEKAFTEAIHQYVSNAEVENLKIQNRDDLDQPLTVSYRLKIPGFATRTGKRLFFQPAIFHANRTSLFPSSTRANPVFFPFAWTEDDTVAITMPAGFALDHADVPAPIKVGRIDYETRAQILNGKTFSYHRSFRVGEGGSVTFPVTVYAAVKKVFDAVQESDNHSITLKVEDKVAVK